MTGPRDPLLVAVLTTTRADYGLYRPLLFAMRDTRREDGSPAFGLKIIAAAAHVLPSQGRTVDAIYKDGFDVGVEVDMVSASGTAKGLATGCGVCGISVAEGLERMKPDLLLILGDRFELLPVATCCLVMRVPMAHLFGGDETEGAIDNTVRHAVTKLSSLHFPSCDDSARRILRMGEPPDRVHVCGHPSLDNVLDSLEPPAKINQLESFQGTNVFHPDELKDAAVRPVKRAMVVYHPQTIDGPEQSLAYFKSLLSALDTCLASGSIDQVLFIRPNIDEGSERLQSALDAYLASKAALPRDDAYAVVFAWKSLPRETFLSLAARSDIFIGNSSAGVLEIPLLKVPTVNIGERQDGRIHAESVVNVRSPFTDEDIHSAIVRGLALDCSGVVHPYFCESGATKRICDILRAHTRESLRGLIKKSFSEYNPEAL